MSRFSLPALLVALLILFLAGGTFFTVSEGQQTVVLQFGRPLPGIRGAGLHFKIPLIQRVRRFERRLLDYSASPRRVVTRDKNTLWVDNFAKWRIADPLKYLQTVRTLEGALLRLDDIIYSVLQNELAQRELIEIVARERAEMMREVTARSDEKASRFGIDIVDVRLRGADLPPANAESVYDRMQAERERIARRYRAEGREEALRIRSEADREKAVLLADAYRKARRIRGEGEARATRIYAEAYRQNPRFYGFLRSLQAYEKSLKSKTTLVLQPQSDFLQFIMHD